MGSRPHAPDLNFARFSGPSWQDFQGFFRGFFRLCERSERASAASEASGATSRQTQHEAAGSLEKITRFPFLIKTGLCWRVFGAQEGFQEALERSRVLKWILSRFGRGLGGQVGAKLGPSWLKSGAKFEKNRFSRGSDASFSFWTGFCSEKVRFWRDLRPLGP